MHHVGEKLKKEKKMFDRGVFAYFGDHVGFPKECVSFFCSTAPEYFSSAETTERR